MSTALQPSAIAGMLAQIYWHHKAFCRLYARVRQRDDTYPIGDLNTTQSLLSVARHPALAYYASEGPSEVANYNDPDDIFAAARRLQNRIVDLLLMLDGQDASILEQGWDLYLIHQIHCI